MDDGWIEGEASSGLPLRRFTAMLGYMAVMVGVCMLASIVPTHRTPRIGPLVALSAEG